MKTTYLFIILICSGLLMYKANAQNPFAKYGVEDRILTLSNGEFEEFFDQDTIVQIGSAMFNTKTNKVIGFIEYDTMYSEATLEPEVVSRWLSPDPLARKYPELCPYNFVGNNPILNIDPDGRKIKPTNQGASSGTSELLASYDKNLGYNNSLFQLDIVSDEDRGDIIGVRSDYTLKNFRKSAKKMGYDLKSEKYQQAENIFKVLKSDDVVEITVIDITTTSEDTEGYSLETQNTNLDNFRSLYQVGQNGEVIRTPSQSEIDNFLNQGSESGDGWGYFPNSNSDSEISGVLIVNPKTSVPMLGGSGSDVSKEQVKKSRRTRVSRKIQDGVDHIVPTE